MTLTSMQFRKTACQMIAIRSPTQAWRPALINSSDATGQSKPADCQQQLLQLLLQLEQTSPHCTVTASSEICLHCKYVWPKHDTSAHTALRINVQTTQAGHAQVDRADQHTLPVVRARHACFRTHNNELQATAPCGQCCSETTEQCSMHSHWCMLQHAQLAPCLTRV